MGPNIQVSVSLVMYKLDVSCYFLVSVYALLNEGPFMPFVPYSLHDLPSLDRYVWLFLGTSSYLPPELIDPQNNTSVDPSP
jgi:hypothetical protein